MTNYSTTYLLCFLFIFNFIFSQTELSNKDIYKPFDSFNNYKNIEIFNGFEYIDTYLDFKKGNHKFYHNENFLLGNVTYNGQPYYDYKMKYDLLNDFLLLEFVNQKINYLKLNTELINEFVVDGHKFYMLPENQELMGFYRNGFFKEAYKGDNYAFYIKYIKNKTERFRDKRVYYVFDEQSIYVLFYKNHYYRINRIRDVINVFPQSKNQIQEFYKNYKKLYKIDREQFFEKLFKSLENLDAININQ